MIKEHVHSIQLEEVTDYYNKWSEYFRDKYRMKDAYDPKMLVRNTSNESGTYPSDNYIYEFLINEQLLGFIYFRRNSFNNCEVIVVDLELKLSDKYYGRS